MRRVFEVSAEIRSAHLISTACGIYYAYLNGNPTDKEMLKPGFTFYSKRLQVKCVEVTDKILQGKNVLGVIVGDGWYRGKMGLPLTQNVYGEKLKLMCLLEIEYMDGHKDTIVSDGCAQVLKEMAD